MLDRFKHFQSLHLYFFQVKQSFLETYHFVSSVYIYIYTTGQERSYTSSSCCKIDHHFATRKWGFSSTGKFRISSLIGTLNMLMLETLVVAKEIVGQVDPYFAFALAKDVYILILYSHYFICVCRNY